MTPRPELELLAPAANAAIGIEAVNHGADAVYIGGPAFGARVHAANEVSAIERLVRHAHRYRARIFVTLNTILRDEELEAARALAWSLYEAGVDALIVQDMGLLELDLPPLQLHASTQADIRTPQKARFLQDVGFSQMVLARELSLAQIRTIAAEARESCLEFFVHGALCVAYSGQCYVSHAQTGRSANRGDCSQACRLPYTLTDGEGRVVAHERHLLSLKDNDQTANLAALVDAGIRSFKIEGRYKDLGYVKNVTAHYRRHLDALLEARLELRPASSGRCRFFFTPDPGRNFHRGHSEYFLRGRGAEIEAFDSPKWAGLPLGHVERVAADHFVVALDEAGASLQNGDGLTYLDLQRRLVGVQVNRAEALADDAPPGSGASRWRIEPNEPMGRLPDLRPGTPVSRNRDLDWLRGLEGKTAQRRIGLRWRLTEEPQGLALEALDEDGHRVRLDSPQDYPRAQQPQAAQAALAQALSRLGASIFESRGIEFAWKEPRFIPASAANAWRRDAVAALEALRGRALARLARRAPLDPPARYPQDSLSYLGNVANARAADFYRRHGVQWIEAAYECHEEAGEVSLMITKHCIRWSLSLCPKQAKGVPGVQGTIRAEPMTMTHGRDRLRLRFDCKACEMHVVGRIRKSVLRDVPAVPVRFVVDRGPRPDGGGDAAAAAGPSGAGG